MFSNRHVILLLALAAVLALTAAGYMLSSQPAAAAVVDTPAKKSATSVIHSVKEPPSAISLGAEKSGLTTGAASCNGEWMGSAAKIQASFYFGYEYYLVYQDPVETGCTNTYPFEVTGVTWEVSVPGGITGLQIQPILFSADLSDPSCPRPGVLLYEGPMYTIDLDPGGWSLGMTTDPFISNCVNGPYFAGVYCPDRINPGIINLFVDSAGVGGGLFPQRTCASYNNYRGLWEDLIVVESFVGNLRLWSQGVNADENSCGDCVTVVEPGADLWVTPAYGPTVDSHFTAVPIAADFFGPGSDPFEGQVAFEGNPLSPPFLGETDAIVERLDRAELPSTGSSDVVDIEIVALNLVSTAPVTVTYDGGLDPENWDVQVCLSELTHQETGQMTITRECCDGGIFSSSLPVLPKFIFSRISDGTIREYDFGAWAISPIVFNTTDGYWSANVPPPFDLVTSAGLADVDHDCNGGDFIQIRPSSNFVPGMRTLPCDETHSGPGAGKTMTVEEALLAAHGVLPPQEEIPVEGEGACCLPDYTCVLTTPGICAANGGAYEGNGTVCYPFPCEPPAVDTVEDCLATTARILISLDPQDAVCSFGESVGLISPAPFPMLVLRPEGPYSAGQEIETEITELDLVGESPELGLVFVQQNYMRRSRGAILVNTVDPEGDLTNGESFFDVFVTVDLPWLELTLIHEVPIRVFAELDSLPPIGTEYLGEQPVPLFSPVGQPVGWLCIVQHTIVGPCTCCRPPNAGDVDCDGIVDIGDVTELIQLLFIRPGDPFCCEAEADLDYNDDIDIGDLTILINRLFISVTDPPPCP